MVAFWKDWVDRYPVVSIEDGMDENDWDGWKVLTDEVGGKIQLVGDDLFVTNTAILKQGIERGAANAILIKVNQIGTLTETLEAIAMAREAGYAWVVFAPLGRNRRHHDRRFGGGVLFGADQDGFAVPHGSRL